MALKHVNAVVIGSGAGGGVAAKVLSEAGLSVVLLERGDWVGFHHDPHDELINQRESILGTGFGPDARHPRVAEGGPGQWRTVNPQDGSYGNNAACVGSGTVSYGAMAWRFMEKDFRLQSIYGSVEGSTLADWPITYQELEPCYERAEYEIGVSGDMSGTPFGPPRAKPYPMPAFPYNLEGKILESAAKRLGWHPFPIPMLRNSISYGGRNACIACRYCCGYACEINAKNGTHNTVIPTALATGNCELRTNCIVSEVLVDDHGKARAVRYFDGEDRGHEQSCDLVVVAGGAIETSRLLLNSKSKLFPQGAGNRHDWVGRNLQSHAYAGAFGLFDHDVFDDMGSGATVAISEFNHGNSGVVGGAMLCNEFIRLPYRFSSTRPPDSARWGKAHKDFQRQYYKRSMTVMGPVQEMPMFDARVEVDSKVKDHWGIPVARLSGNRHPHDEAIVEAIIPKAVQWLNEAGAVKTWEEGRGNKAQRGGQHQAGTCRMGNDPKTSVTNRYGQVHEIDNLFIADGSLHVTNGGFNPALTIMALGYWVGEYIVSSWKGGGLK